jgi:hypothetical protein
MGTVSNEFGKLTPGERIEILPWQAFALRRPALSQDDGGLREVCGSGVPHTHLENREMWGTLHAVPSM